MFPSVPEVSIYRNVQQFGWIDLRLAKVNVQPSIEDRIILNRKLPLRENTQVLLMCTLHCWLRGHRIGTVKVSLPWKQKENFLYTTPKSKGVSDSVNCSSLTVLLPFKKKGGLRLIYIDMFLSVLS